MLLKIKCKKCDKIKSVADFPTRKDSSTGYRLKCKKCCKISQREYYNLNNERQKADAKKYYHNNKEHAKLCQKKYRETTKNQKKEYNKQYRIKNKNKIAACQLVYVRRRRRADINYKLTHNLRRRLHHALKGNFKTGSAVRDLGCTIDELKTHLEAQFQPGMTWDNWSRTGWHIDHIIPLSSFDLTNRDELKKACHYTNLRPLWAEENIKKSNKMSA